MSLNIRHLFRTGSILQRWNFHSVDFGSAVRVGEQLFAIRRGKLPKDRRQRPSERLTSGHSSDEWIKRSGFYVAHYGDESM